MSDANTCEREWGYLAMGNVINGDEINMNQKESERNSELFFISKQIVCPNMRFIIRREMTAVGGYTYYIDVLTIIPSQ